MQGMIKLYRKLAKLVIHRQFALAVTSREIEVKTKNFDLLLVHTLKQFVYLHDTILEISYVNQNIKRSSITPISMCFKWTQAKSSHCKCKHYCKMYFYMQCNFSYLITLYMEATTCYTVTDHYVYCQLSWWQVYMISLPAMGKLMATRF